MSDPAVYVFVYGLAVAPLGMGMLSLQIRRATARLPLRRARLALQALCKRRGWGGWADDGSTVSARGTVSGTSVHLHVGADPGGNEAPHAVWIRIRFPRAEDDGWPSQPLLIDLSRGLVLRGDLRAGQALLGSELGRFARNEDLIEVTASEVRFDRFASGVTHEDLAMVTSRVVHTWTDLTREAPSQVLRRQLSDAPSPEVRLGALLGLSPRPTEVRPGRNRESIARALGDADERVRLEAALRLGDDAIEVLECLVDRARDGDVRLRGFVALSRRRPDAAVRRLEALMRDRDERLALGAVARAEALGAHEKLEELLLDPRAPTAPRVAALTALEHTGNEPLMLACLTLDSPDALLVAVLEALGRHGGAKSASRIGTFSSRGIPSRRVSLAVRSAMELIKTRVRVERGRLSLSAPVVRGAISLDTQQGKNSRPDPKTQPQRGTEREPWDGPPSAAAPI